MRTARVVIVGAGIGGLAAAIRLARAGISVAVVEKASAVGGKMREVVVEGRPIGSGPTVLTMRGVFDELLASAGTSLDAEVGLTPLDVIARHAWSGGAVLDLHSEPDRSAEAIGRLAGAAEARGYLAFCDRARRIFETLDDSFIRSGRLSVPGLVRRVGPTRLASLAGISPFTTLWRALEGHFRDPRLRQLFGRYATYCGGSPFLSPATLMLVAHVEREGVWTVEGGMQRLAEALRAVAERAGATFRLGTEAREILAGGGRATGVRLGDGEVIEADAVVANADVGAFAAGLLGPDVVGAAPPVRPSERSLSAVTWSLLAETGGVPLAHHTVFFSDDGPAEFDRLRRGRLPDDPTVYVCAEDRGEAAPPPRGPERLFLICNAPARGDDSPLSPEETAQCEMRTFRRLERCGLTVRARPGSGVVSTPTDFARRFPGTGGALYGRAPHGWMASFRRPGSRSRIPGLYLAGGSTHPGPGVPMAAISGTLAASSLVEDLASTSRSRPAAMPGGMSTR